MLALVQELPRADAGGPPRAPWCLHCMRAHRVSTTRIFIYLLCVCRGKPEESPGAIRCLRGVGLDRHGTHIQQRGNAANKVLRKRRVRARKHAPRHAVECRRFDVVGGAVWVAEMICRGAIVLLILELVEIVEKSFA